MRQPLTVEGMWKKFLNKSMPGLETTTSLRFQLVKTTYYKAMRDLLCECHNVLGDESIPEEQGAATLQGWLIETDTFFKGMAEGIAREVPHE